MHKINSFNVEESIEVLEDFKHPRNWFIEETNSSNCFSSRNKNQDLLFNYGYFSWRFDGGIKFLGKRNPRIIIPRGKKLKIFVPWEIFLSSSRIQHFLDFSKYTKKARFKRIIHPFLKSVWRLDMERWMLVRQLYFSRIFWRLIEKEKIWKIFG